jgi:hypothetical protein
MELYVYFHVYLHGLLVDSLRVLFIFTFKCYPTCSQNLSHKYVKFGGTVET